MRQAEIQRQYDEVIAPHYDLDPLAVKGESLARALTQLGCEACLSGVLPPMDLLDVGIGTGLFCARLRRESERVVRPFGLDISKQMINVAMARVPDLVAAVDDAANIGRHFRHTLFDVICTHYVTGFVPLSRLAPDIFARLKPGGYWSIVGGTSQGFAELRRLAQSRPLKMLLGSQTLDLSNLNTPADQDEVVGVLRNHSFEIRHVETFVPELCFGSFDEFMEFAWRGGWLTAFIEELGLHNAGRALRSLLNMFVFPVSDTHRIVIALARKPLNHALAEAP